MRFLDAYERFCDVRIKIDKAPSSATDLDGRTLAVDGTELKIVEDLASKGLEIEEQYQRSIEQLRKAKSDEDKNRTKQLVDQSIRDFEKFVPETSKANVEEVILKLEAVQQENEVSSFYICISNVQGQCVYINCICKLDECFLLDFSIFIVNYIGLL